MWLLFSSGVTDTELTIIHGLINRGHLALVLAKNAERVFKLSREDYDNGRIVPILLDLTLITNTEKQVQKIVRLFPHIHHIVNFESHDDKFRTVVVNRFQKNYCDKSVVVDGTDAGANDCAQDIHEEIEIHQSRGILFNIVQKEAKKPSSFRKIYKTLSIRRKYEPPRSRAASVTSFSSSSTASGFTCLEEGNGNGAAGNNDHQKFRHMHQKFKTMHKEWEAQLDTQPEAENKRRELEDTIKTYENQVEDLATRQAQVALNEFKEEKISEDAARERIQVSKEEAKQKLGEYRGKRQSDVDEHVNKHREQAPRRLYMQFLEDEIKVLQELRPNSPVRLT